MKTLERLPGVQTIGIGSGQSKPLIRGLGFNRVVVVDRGIKHEGQQWGSDHGLELDQFAAGEVELIRSEEHTSELQSLMRISYAVFCLKKKNQKTTYNTHENKHTTTKQSST